MSEAFIGEIRIFAGTFAPVGWLPCDGRPLPISQYDALFALIGTTYGGDGQTTFALPDLRGRAPVHAGPGLLPGATGGAEAVTLTGGNLPAHTHTAAAATGATSASPAGGVWSSQSAAAFGAATGSAALAGSAVSAVGGGQPHENMPPFLAVPYIIAVEGIFPSRP